MTETELQQTHRTFWDPDRLTPGQMEEVRDVIDRVLLVVRRRHTAERVAYWLVIGAQLAIIGLLVWSGG